MKELKRVPLLRFKEFVNDWSEIRLEKLCHQISYGLTVRPDFIKKGIPLISAREIISGKVKLENAPRISQADFDKLSDKAKPQKGDIFLTKTGTIGYSTIFDSDITIAITQNIAVIRLKDVLENNPYFIIQFFKTQKFQRAALAKVNQSTIMDLQLGDIRQLIIPKSSPREQQKIATFLSSVDKKIDQLEQKKSLLEQYKKGVMQQLFSQQLRFKPARPIGGDDDGNDFPDWEEKKLGELLDYEQPTKYIVKSTEYEDTYNTPVLTAGKSFILGYTNEEDNIFTKTPVIIFDDFTMANKYVDFNFKVKSSAMKILKPFSDRVNIKFVYESIQMINYPKGDEHKRFWISEYSRIKIKYPCAEEQTKIANFLSAIDTKIETVNTQIESTQQFKKGLLQQMFV